MSLQIPFLTKEEEQESINYILNQGLPPYKSAAQIHKENFKKIFMGPGLNVLFYHSKLIVIESISIYFFFLGICLCVSSFLSVSSATAREYTILFLFPLMNITFHTLSCWAEEQDSIIELKQSMHYSFYHMVSLRMFYVSLFSSVLNVIVACLTTPLADAAKICVIGLSGLFVFSILTLFLYQKMQEQTSLLVVTLLWMGFYLLCLCFNEKFSYLLFHVIPMCVYIFMLVISLSLFIYYVGKVGSQYAYTYEYQ